MRLRCEHLQKSYQNQRVINDLSLVIEPGEFVVLIGPSGCGKSTLLKMLNRLILPDQGCIYFDDQAIDTLNPNHLRRKMGYVIQSTGLFPHWTVAKNILTVPRLLGWDKGRCQQRLEEVMAAVDLDYTRFAEAMPAALSGGQAQRVGVARALAADPDVLLMDEPFAALDPITRQSLQQLLLKIQKQSAKSIVFVTHDMDEALLLADKIALIQEGRIAQFSDPEILLTQPANDFVQSFLGGADLGLKLLDRRQVERYLKPALRTQNPDHYWQVDEAGRPVQLIGGHVDTQQERTTVNPEWLATPKMSLKEALSRLVWYRVLYLPIVDTEGYLIGELPLSAVMSPQPEVDI